MGAGKSAAIKVLSDIDVVSTEARNTDVESHTKYLTTVGIDYGEICLEDGIKIGLYGTPGQDRFNFMWSIVCKGALGTVILIDHTGKNNKDSYGSIGKEIGLDFINKIDKLKNNSGESFTD